MSNESQERRHCGICRDCRGEVSAIANDIEDRGFPLIGQGANHCEVYLEEVVWCSKCGNIGVQFTRFCSITPLPSYWREHPLENFRLDRSKEPPVLEPLVLEPPELKGKPLPSRIELHTAWSANSLSNFTIVPTAVEQLPDCVPLKIQDIYYDAYELNAYEIKEIGPKVAVPLALRCLRVMIRDFFRIEKLNLKEEIDAIKGKNYVSDEVWETIQTVRGKGNIGTHMEQDATSPPVFITDSDEAKELIRLIEYLVEKWYVARKEI